MTKKAAQELIEGLFRRTWDKEDLIQIALQIESGEEREIDEVLTIAGLVTGVPKDDIIPKKRKGNRPLARSLCYSYLRDCGYTLSYIGEVFNNRNHATILHSLRTLKNDLQTKHKPTLDAFNRFNEIIKE